MVKSVLCLLLLAGLPLIGLIISEVPIDFHTRFSPSAIVISSKDILPPLQYSAPATYMLAVFGALLLGAFFFQFIRALINCPSGTNLKNSFPFWGYSAFISLILFWYLAWNKPHFGGSLKLLIFPFLWVSYITLVNAFSYWRSGSCLLISHKDYFLKLFLYSIPFWWYFEYLNRFVLNWFYLTDSSSTSVEHLIFGSLAFATVLPAVMSTRELILSFSSISGGFNSLAKIQIKRPFLAAGLGLILSSLSLAFLGVWPQYLFPFLWISPLFLVISLQTFWGKKHLFNGASQGHYSLIISSGLAGLFCGFFWELWNFYSIPQWIYHVPWIGGVKIFEMPVLGYLGYLPFGLECALAGQLIWGLERHALQANQP